MKSYADDIPKKYPIALAICGHKFSNIEQKTIATAIKDYFTYELALIRRENKKNFTIFIIMTLVMLISGIFLQYIPENNLTLLEYMYVLFWFGADICIAFLLFDGRASRRQHIMAARLSSLYVYFDEKYDESDLLDEEAKQIRNEIFSDNI